MIEDSSTKQNNKVHICTKNIISILCVIFIYYWVSYKLPGLLKKRLEKVMKKMECENS